ncbi:MAG TPA: 1,4-dihydroxy-2-naphthoate polyprenyltransferase [Kiritimatiellia bacterium]|nr:1,4-dihydroxy-2-naphthoate polyprenyltransferase [Kiritimatiellia bacterium]HMP00224.1 1,4-dihydroxy-2-naphthoate polyprenyltransferase [Kiritimatiellia bacterium]HMP97178.1 1,4-dihydroxy-2-naphthoate polyprenyltransferase [Kiritimatiellia bacterium]
MANILGFKAWILAARPKTLWAAVGPVMIGTAMAQGEGLAHGPVAAACLLGAILLQIGTNFSNDYSDFMKGADTPDRVGPARAVASGWITPSQMLIATWVTFSLAALVCGYLVMRGGWPLLALGAISIAAGLAYTAGPYPLAYRGLGDLFVLIFFGPVATAGTYYVQTQAFSWAPVLAGLGPGLLSVAILTVNNLRDVEGDRKAGKKTLVVRFGPKYGRFQYAACVVLASAIPYAVVALFAPMRGNTLMSCLILFAAWPVMRLVFTRTGRDLNPGLGMTALLLLVYSMTFSMGWLMPAP